MVGGTTPIVPWSHADRSLRRQNGRVETYSAFPLGRRFPLLIVGFLVVVDLATMGAGGLLFNVLFLVLLLLAAYWFCWRMVSELALDGPNVTWRASLRSGVFNVQDLVRIEPGRPPLEYSAETLVFSDGTVLPLIGGSWFRSFCDRLRLVRPELPISFTAQMKVVSACSDAETDPRVTPTR